MSVKLRNICIITELTEKKFKLIEKFSDNFFLATFGISLEVSLTWIFKTTQSVGNSVAEWLKPFFNNFFQ